MRERSEKFVIEIDGGQHLDSLRDQVRDEFLQNLGYRVLRFWNNEVLSNVDGVLQVIDAELRGWQPLTPTLSPLKRGEGEE